MDGRREEQPLSDSALDRELETALGVDPSPQFLARVRMRVAAERSSWRPSLPWLPALAGRAAWRPQIRRSAFAPLVAAAIVGVVLAIVIPRGMREDSEVTSASAHVAARGTLDAAPAVEANVSVPPARARQPVRAGRIRRQPVAPDRAESPRTVPLQLGPVLFAEEDKRAFALFIAAVSEGRVPPAPADAVGVEPMAAIPELAIEPLVIEPLPLLARGGERGGNQW